MLSLLKDTAVSDLTALSQFDDGSWLPSVAPVPDVI